jgi:hypothetical protein
MPLLDFNMNMNMDFNMNMGSPGSSVGGNWTRVRFNSEDYRKYLAMVGGSLADPVIPANPGAFRFPGYWDAELQAYEYLEEFLRTYDWRTRLNGPGGLTLTSTHLLPTTSQIRDEIIYVLDQAPDRQDRFQEILSQHSGEGAIGYFLGMLMIDPSRLPAMHLLMRVARRIGEHISMVLKGEFRCPRPSQLCAAIVPMIDPPATPSYPSGHSLQARLIARCIGGTTLSTVPPHLLTNLSDRIGENRIIAGIHYRNDHTAGVAVADWCYTTLLAPLVGNPAKLFDRLMRAVNNEIAHLADTQPPL